MNGVCIYLPLPWPLACETGEKFELLVRLSPEKDPEFVFSSGLNLLVDTSKYNEKELEEALAHVIASLEDSGFKASTIGEQKFIKVDAYLD